MKKFYLLVIMLLAIVGSASAQTYYYKFISRVHSETGVKSSYSGDFYITFTNNKAYCYQSSADGNQIEQPYRIKEFGQGETSYSRTHKRFVHHNCDGSFKYMGEVNNMYQYRCYYYYSHLDTSRGNVREVKDEEGYLHLYFSKDFTRINIVSYSNPEEILVAVKSVPETEKRKQEAVPTQMW